MKEKWFKNTSSFIPVKYHVLFWTGYFTFNVIRWGSYFNDYWYSLKSNLVEFPLHIILVYINIYYLIPKFILTKKYITYITLFLGFLFVLYSARTGLNYVLVTENIWPEAESQQQAFTFNHIIAVTLGEIYVVALATAIKLTADWIYERKRNEDLQKIQLKTELKFLKSQIQPHFFFNTLNNLYALTLEKSDVAPEVVLKLSDIMQHVLYDMKEPLVRLFDVIRYIQNYLDLERLRYGDKIISTIEIIGEIEDVKVPPLLFLPFIENSFKHGVKNVEHFKVNITFENMDNKYLNFTVENAIDEQQNINNTSNHGIGNHNVKRRLELLFKDNFELKTYIANGNYCVQLKIPIQ
ncbi:MULTISPECIES: sensor histidine kinase [Flavobacteriaceae]|uniref:Sensor histidine kinase n=1 Tax=Lutibacter litoralis TaxID=321268 RepID=A0ABV5K189_9FLAO|nr:MULTISPECIES: histidine kinase [Flavobacteriaceae]GGK43049.1 histidine kinase [Lutibacter litoralis]